MDSAETDKTVRVVSRVGAILPAHCTAVGKAHLAFLPQPEIERLYTDNILEKHTERSLGTRTALLEDLKRTAERGWALENEEADQDVRGIAVPVRDFSDSVIAAIGIVAPAHRLPDGEKLEQWRILPDILDAGRTLSHKLGFGGKD